MSGGNPPRRNLRELPVIVGSPQETVAKWVEPRGYPILSVEGGGWHLWLRGGGTPLTELLIGGTL